MIGLDGQQRIRAVFTHGEGVFTLNVLAVPRIGERVYAGDASFEVRSVSHYFENDQEQHVRVVMVKR